MTEFVTGETRVYADGVIEGGPGHPFEFRFYSEGQDFAFNGDGAWDNLEFWTVNGQAAIRLPNSLDNVTIESGICHMTDGAQFGALTIEDGAEFYPIEDAEITATVKKNIDAYQGLGGWYLLSFPTNFDAPDFVGAGMITNSAYDLFFFDQNFPGEVEDETSENGEWRNYKYYMQNGLNFIAPMITNNGVGICSNGYLYANKANTTLSFTGMLYTSGSLVYNKIPVTGTDQPGVNLLGNPYTCKAEITTGNRIDAMYMINELRDDVVVYDPEGEAAYNVINPMTSFFALARTNNNTNCKVTFTPFDATQHEDGEEPGIIRGRGLNQMTIEVNSNNILKDRVYVKMGEGENSAKFSLRKDGTKLYVPENGKKYAIAYTEGANVMPLCFTTNESGIYTLNFNTKNMSCSYLHLIDNVTGADIDLFQTPSYTFNSSDSNYATRFKLVFSETATNEIVENFAFISNGELMINNSGNATLQVIDITGRILSSENIQNCYSKSLNLSAGVYVVRLSNGNDVKTQKIVVE
jgi:hypothetical protein